MGTRKCAVCGKDVRDGDETEHLRTNHLGPHYFWFDAKKYRTERPSMTGGEIKQWVRQCERVPDYYCNGYQLYMDKRGIHGICHRNAM